MTEISIGGLPLETLAEMANEAAELAERDMVSAVGRAWDCGRYLLAAKQQVPHGQWQHWVRVNFDRELRTASRYMQLAGAFPSRAAIAEAASIRQAMRMISQPEEVPVDEPELELVEEVEAEPEVTPEIEPQERPSIRKVSAESRKVGEADREPTPEVRPVVEPELVEDERLKKIGLRLGDMLTGCGKTWLVTGRKVDSDGYWVELTEEAEA